MTRRTTFRPVLECPAGRSYLARWRVLKTLMALAAIGAVASWAPRPARAGELAAVRGVSQDPAGPGTMRVDRSLVAASGDPVSLTFTYTAASPLRDGQVTLTVPGGWTAPASAPGAPGFVYTTAPCGSNYCIPAVTDMTVTISGISLAPGQQFVIGYTDAAAPNSAASFDFTAQVIASGLGTSNLPTMRVTTCPNGVGTLAVSPDSVPVSTTRQFKFTYTADNNCGLLKGSAVTIDVPVGWSRPSTHQGEQGYTYAEGAGITVSGSRITITNAVLKPGSTLTAWYSGAVPASPGDTFFYTAEQSGDNAVLTDLPVSPRITVQGGGSGTMTVSPLTVTASRRSTLTFTYTAPPGGLHPSGWVTLTVPPGWTAPRAKPPNVSGYTSSTAGTVSVSGRRIKVTGARLAAHRTLKITYRDGSAPRSTGETEFKAFESQSDAARLSPVAPSPVITVTGAAPRPPWPWRDFLLGAALGAVCATLAALGTRFLRKRVRATQVATVSHRDPPRVAPIQSTGSEPTLALRIEPRAGPTVRTLESKS